MIFRNKDNNRRNSGVKRIKTSKPFKNQSYSNFFSITKSFRKDRLSVRYTVYGIEAFV